MIELEVTPEHSAFVQGEEVTLWVRITNKGKASLEFPDPELALAPQPVFSLQSPGATGPTSFAVGPEAGDDAGALPKDAAKVTLEAGQSWEGVVELNTLADLSQPGEYKLSSTFEWEKEKAESETTTFVIEPLTISSVQLGIGRRPMENGEGEIALIHKGDQVGSVYSARFAEIRPSIGEASVDKPFQRVRVSSDANDIAVPWRNTPFFDEMLQWLVWQEGGELKALSTVAEEPISTKLPGGSNRIVIPPLKVFEGPLDVFIAAPEDRKLGLVRFATDAEEPAGALAWQVDLPHKPQGITAALGPVDAGSERHIVFVAAADDGFEIYHAHFKADAKPGPFMSARVPGLHPLDRCPPAVFVESDGTTIVGMLGTAGDSVLAGTYVEVRFTPDGAPGKQNGIVQLGYFNAEPTEAAVLLADRDGVVVRRDVVVKLGDQGLFKMGPEGGLEPLSAPGTPTDPILLAPGKNTSYILYTDPKRGLYMEPL